MSQSNRGNLTGLVITIAGGCATAHVIGVLIWSFAVSHTENRMKAESYAAQYADDTDKQVKERCALADPVTMVECVADIVKAQHESQRDEYDLQAQRQMANWAFWLLIVTIGSTVVTLAGIYYVRENLLEMRTTNKFAELSTQVAKAAVAEAARATQSARWSARDQNAYTRQGLRAYICFDRANIDFTNVEHPNIRVWFKNFGQTPARNVRIWIHTWVANHPLDHNLPEPPSDLLMGNSILGPGAETFHEIRHAGSIRPQDVPLIESGTVAIYVYGRATYSDVFGENRFTRYRLLYHGHPCVGATRNLMPASEGNVDGVILEGDEYES